MRISPVILLLTMLIISFSCKKDKEEIPVNGEVTISSKLHYDGTSYYPMGFSFTKAELLKYSDQDFDNIDIVVIRRLNTDGSIKSILLTSPPGIEKVFNLTAEFDNSTDASDFFDNYLEVTTNEFEIFADSLKQHQVWTYQRDADETYAKFQILDLNLYTSQTEEEYGTVTIKWQYQPDGGKLF